MLLVGQPLVNGIGGLGGYILYGAIIPCGLAHIRDDEKGQETFKQNDGQHDAEPDPGSEQGLEM
jgi:hypothetical protein